MRPTHSTPTVSPTKAAITFLLKRPVATEIPVTEINDIKSKTATIYGVDINDIDVATIYSTGGVISMTINPNVDTEDALAELEKSFADVLDIPTSDIILEYNPDTNEVKYKIISPTFDDLITTNSKLLESGLTTDLDSALKLSIVDDVKPTNILKAELEATVDVNDVSIDLENSNQFLDNIFSSDYVVNVASKIFLCHFFQSVYFIVFLSTCTYQNANNSTNNCYSICSSIYDGCGC